MASCKNHKQDWRLEYNKDIGWYQYVNTKDNSVTFDLPCEVNYVPGAKNRNFFGRIMTGSLGDVNKDGERKSMLARLGSILRHRRNDSRSKLDDMVTSVPGREKVEENKNDEVIPAEDLAEVEYKNDDDLRAYYNNSVISDFDNDLFLVGNSDYSKNFAGTSMLMHSSCSLTEDDESIRSYYDDEDGRNIQMLDLDREKELHELRVQFMREMES